MVVAERGVGGGGLDEERRADIAAQRRIQCWRCKAPGHYSHACTAKLWDRCGGSGHNSSVCATLMDKEVGSPQEAVLAVVGGPESEDDDL